MIIIILEFRVSSHFGKDGIGMSGVVNMIYFNLYVLRRSYEQGSIFFLSTGALFPIPLIFQFCTLFPSHHLEQSYFHFILFFVFTVSFHNIFGLRFLLNIDLLVEVHYLLVFFNHQISEDSRFS